MQKQKWEYCQVKVAVGVSINGEEQNVKKSIEMWYCQEDKEAEIIKHEDTSMLLAKLGNEGWEVVGYSSQSIEVSDGSIVIASYVLKRPK